MRAKKEISVRKVLGLVFGQTALFILVILAVCVATPLHTALLHAFDAPGRSGFSPEEVDKIARAMVSVMRGADGEILARWFTADEVMHMQDVQRLFALGVRLLIGLCGLCIACMAGGRRPLSGEYRRAFWMALLVPAAAALPFIADFDGTWVFLHRVAFPGNELWLMDPRVHMMVVIYNGQFFVAAVAVIGILCALSALPLAVAAVRGKEK